MLSPPLPREVAPPPKAVASPPVASTSPSLPKDTLVDAPSRKRVRNELEGVNQSPPQSEERSVKKQKIGVSDTLSLIQKHRTPATSTSISTNLASRIEVNSDTPMMDVSSSKQRQSLGASIAAPGISIKGAAIDVPLSSSGFSIRGAAAPKVSDKGTHPSQPSYSAQRSKVGQSNAPVSPPLNRGASITSVMQKLKIQPASPVSAPPTPTGRSSIKFSGNGNRHLPSPNSPAALDDSVKRLLLGKPGSGSSKQERFTAAPPQSLPQSSLLDRIAGSNQTNPVPVPALQPQKSAATIFDRVGIPPGARGNGNAGTRNNGNKRRGM